jgi:ribosomal protein S18 acetylase RimI-like enzyme
LPIRKATEEEISIRFDRDPARVAVALVGDDEDSALLVRDSFDSEILGLEVGRLIGLSGGSPESRQELLLRMSAEASAGGFEQVLRRTDAGALAEIWALERSSFELMDIGVTFSQRPAAARHRPPAAGLTVRVATDDDMKFIVPRMIAQPWGSRYEADPRYSAQAVEELRSRWLWNSHKGRAAAVMVGVIDETPAGYVTCLLDAKKRHGEIELVGTLPDFRGRGVASGVLGASMEWFTSKAELVTVRTQATNYAAANLYERAGFTLSASDLTFRLSLNGHVGGTE